MTDALVGHQIELISRDGVDLALHSWRPARPRAVIFYVHGLQSHAGWLTETGPALAKRGVALFAADRRGSGRSGGPRGEAPSFQVWIDDLLALGEIVAERYPSLPRTLLGQSMGGSLAVGLAVDPRARFDATLLCTPAINHRRGRTTDEQKRELRGRAPSVQVAVPLKDEWYTKDPRHLSFMRDDTLMLRTVANGTLIELLALEEHYMSLPMPAITNPSLLILARQDSIIDATIARAAFLELVGPSGLIVEFSLDQHYIEFSSCRDRLWDLWAMYATTIGFTVF